MTWNPEDGLVHEPERPASPAAPAETTRSLRVPDAAVAAATDAAMRVYFGPPEIRSRWPEADRRGWEEVTRAAVAVAAPLIVAAELRRLAQWLDCFASVGEKAPNQAGVRMLRTVKHSIRMRITELEDGVR